MVGRSVFLCGIVCLASAGCATVFRGNYDSVQVRSRPGNAEVLVDGVAVGRTPVVARLSSSQGHTIVVRAPGYQDQVLRTESILRSGWVVLDVFFGVVPVIVDAGTGAWYEVQPGPANVILKPQDGASPVESMSFTRVQP